MPADVTPLHGEGRRCQDCGTLAVKRTDEYGELLVCPNDDCHNIVVLAMPMREPASRRAAALDPERTKRFVTDQVGRAEREATAILAEYSPINAQQVHALVAYAWGRGFVAGFGSGTEEFAATLEELQKGVRR